MDSLAWIDFLKGKKVLITGNTGFIGSWLSMTLKELGAKLYGYSLAPNTKPSLFELLDLDSLVETKIADIRDANSLEAFIANNQPDIVFHLAAQPFVRDSYKNPVETYSVNVMGTVKLLEAIRECNSVKRVIVMTTDKCYENLEWEWGYRENDRLGGRDPYSNSKACTELVVSAYRESFLSEAGVAVASVRAGNVIGGGDWANDRIIPDAVKSVIENRKLLVRNPLSIRPWQHVLEPIFGMITLASKLDYFDNEFCSEWNLGPSSFESYNVEQLLDAFFEYWPEAPGWKIDNSYHPHEANLLKLDSSKAYEKLHWKPKLTFEEMSQYTAEWYQSFISKKDMPQLMKQQITSYLEKTNE